MFPLDKDLHGCRQTGINPVGNGARSVVGSRLGTPNPLPVILPKDERREARFWVLIQGRYFRVARDPSAIVG